MCTHKRKRKQKRVCTKTHIDNSPPGFICINRGSAGAVQLTCFSVSVPSFFCFFFFFGGLKQQLSRSCRFFFLCHSLHYPLTPLLFSLCHPCFSASLGLFPLSHCLFVVLSLLQCLITRQAKQSMFSFCFYLSVSPPPSSLSPVNSHIPPSLLSSAVFLQFLPLAAFSCSPLSLPALPWLSITDRSCQSFCTV